MLRGQLTRLLDAVEDREGRLASMLDELTARLAELRARRAPLERRMVELAKAAARQRQLERSLQRAAKQALPDQERALDRLRRAHRARRAAELYEHQSAALEPLAAAYRAQLATIERELTELRSAQERLRAREVLVELGTLSSDARAMRRATVADETSAVSLLARWDALLVQREAEREVTALLDEPWRRVGSGFGSHTDASDDDCEQALRAALAQLLENT